MNFFRLHLDFLGFSASFLCAIHCLAMPFVLTIGMFSGLTWLEAPLFEWSMLIVSITLAIWSLLPSYLRKHGNTKPLQILGVGIVFLVASRFPEGELEHWLTAAGGFLLAFAHWHNWKALKSCLNPKFMEANQAHKKVA